MKMETFCSQCSEIFVEQKDTDVMVNTWSNCEGVNIIMSGKDRAIRLAASLHWEEVDLLTVALTAARSA